MTYANELLQEGSHAFRGELYHKQRASPSMVLESLMLAKLVKDHGGGMHRLGRVVHRDSSRRSLEKLGVRQSQPETDVATRSQRTRVSFRVGYTRRPSETAQQKVAMQVMMVGRAHSISDR